MYKLVPVLVLTAVAGVSIPVPVVAAERLMAPLSSAADTVVPQAALVLVGGMGGDAATGGMGGGAMTGGGIGGITGGGAPAYGGAAGFGDTPGGGYQWNGSSYARGEGQQQYYHCIAQHGQCSVASSPGSLRRGESCTCLFGGRGKIR